MLGKLIQKIYMNQIEMKQKFDVFKFRMDVKGDDVYKC